MFRGSQNGFDNSGRTLVKPTGIGWSGSPENIDRTLKAVRDIANAIKRDGIDDVVTGFGVLNEPFKKENEAQVKDFDERAFETVRGVLGPDVVVYIGDMFDASRFQDFWDSDKYKNTVLDSHYYHVFAEAPRSFSPRQHIAYVCEKNSRDLNACCHDGATGGLSKGMRRMIGEWSVAFDTLVCAKLDDVMASYKGGGEVLGYSRTIEKDRKDFLRNFAEAQMVAWESRGTGVSVGWFYWNFKMEGGAFAEWDYLRGVREGWIPVLGENQPAEDVFGSCESIIFRTDDEGLFVHEFPDPTEIAPDWQAVDADDDVVVTHGDSLLNLDPPPHPTVPLPELPMENDEYRPGIAMGVASLCIFLGVTFALSRFCFRRFWDRKDGYVKVGNVVDIRH